MLTSTLSPPTLLESCPDWFLPLAACLTSKEQAEAAVARQREDFDEDRATNDQQ